MSVAIRADREGDHARLVATGPFDLAHATMAARAVENAEALLAGCGSVDVDLAQLERIDGAGAVLLARLLDRLGWRHSWGTSLEFSSTRQTTEPETMTEKHLGQRRFNRN